jgi:hypothetical protein
MSHSPDSTNDPGISRYFSGTQIALYTCGKEETTMKFWLCSLAILALLKVPAAVASEQEENDPQDQFKMELEIHPTPQRYTFQNYLSDLTDLARSFNEPAPENAIRELESRKKQKYEPLNPIIIPW